MNVIGAGILFFSFQATSSNFRLITTPDGRSALCVDKRALIIAEPSGGFRIGAPDCPDWEHARPAAVVNFEHPSFVTIGLLLVVLGFVVQFLSIPGPKTIAEIRADLKAARLRKKG